MSPYNLLLALHISCVIVWLGTSTTLSLLAAYSGSRRDPELSARLPALQAWFGPRAIGPSSVGTLASGIALALYRHANFGELWLALALSAFAAATLVSLSVRLPATLRRKRALAAHSSVEVARAERWLAWGSLLELAILYLAVLDMVLKPTAADSTWLVGGAIALSVFALGTLLAPRLPGSAT